MMSSWFHAAVCVAAITVGVAISSSNDRRWIETPEANQVYVTGDTITLTWTFDLGLYEINPLKVIPIYISKHKPDMPFEHVVAAQMVNATKATNLTVIYKQMKENTKVTYRGNGTITLTIHDVQETGEAEIFLQVELPYGNVDATTLIQVFTAPSWERKIEQKNMTILKDAPYNILMKPKTGIGIPSIVQMTITFTPMSDKRRKRKTHDPILRVTPHRSDHGAHFKCLYSPRDFEKLIRYSGDSELSDIILVLPHPTTKNNGRYDISIEYSITNVRLTESIQVMVLDTPATTSTTVIESSSTTSSAKPSTAPIDRTNNVNAFWPSRCLVVFLLCISRLIIIDNYMRS